MSNATREINRITTAIIRISMKLIVYALIILLLYEAVIKGYAFGHQIFYAEAMEEAPGHDMTVTIEPDTSVSEAAQMLADDGLINSEFAFIFQSMFYDYDAIYPGVYDLNTSMTSKEILQQLNEKPETEEDVKPAQSGAGKAAAAPAAKTAETAGETVPEGEAGVPAAASQTGAAEDTGSQEAAGRSMDPEAENSDEIAN